MFKVAIIGASGYAGAQLVNLVTKHPQMSLEHTCVSEHSQDAGKSIAQLHGFLAHLTHITLAPVSPSMLSLLATEMDAVFLATPHEASHDWMTTLSSGKAKIFDLSGAFRLQDTQIFKQFYGFEHTSTCLDKAVYGLAEYNSEAISQASIVAVPGCYPTASLLGLLPLQQAGVLDHQVRPIINAVSGVSGAGRKANLGTSFYEVSLQAYGVLGHRHTPEIEAYLGTPVIFTPHLGNFKHGILATITVKLNEDVSAKDVDAIFQQQYANQPIIRLRDRFPKVDDVAHTPYCDIFWKVDEDSGYAVIGSAIDNTLKGAASQAMQCANLALGLTATAGLITGS
jgi:N-acetyl-gamma-glutamyl-phosphate reductase